MSTLIFKDALFVIDSTDLSSEITEVSVNYASEMQDETAMGDSTRVRKGGLKDWSFDITFNQDFAASKVDATLFSLVGTTSCIEVRPINMCSTGVNPIFSGIAVLESYPPLSGSVGSLLQARATFQSAGNLSRASSS